MKKCDIYLIYAQNIDFGYTLEPPEWRGSNEYPFVLEEDKKMIHTQVKTSFTTYT